MLTRATAPIVAIVVTIPRAVFSGGLVVGGAVHVFAPSEDTMSPCGPLHATSDCSAVAAGKESAVGSNRETVKLCPTHETAVNWVDDTLSSSLSRFRICSVVHPCPCLVVCQAAWTIVHPCSCALCKKEARCLHSQDGQQSTRGQRALSSALVRHRS